MFRKSPKSKHTKESIANNRCQNKRCPDLYDETEQIKKKKLTNHLEPP